MIFINVVNAQQISSEGLSLLWVRYGAEGWAYATCVIGSTVYVIGYYHGGNGVVEARDINTGELLYMYQEPFYVSDTELLDCVVLDGYLYVVGHDFAPDNYEWLILKFTPDLKLVSKKQFNPTNYNDFALAIATDGKYLYIGGYAIKTWGDSEWLLLKVDPSDLSIVNTYKTNPSTGWDSIWFIGVNPVDNKIWLVGDVNGSFGRVEVLSQDLTLITSKYLEHFCDHMTFDELGYAYTACGSEILKMSSNLDIVTRKDIIDIIPLGSKILYSNGHLYLATSKYMGGYWRHVVMMLSKDLDVLDELVLSMQINASSYFDSRGKMALVNNKLLVAGTDYTVSRGRWVIYAINTSFIATLVRVNVVHADGSAASGAYVCIDNVCRYADVSGAVVFSIQKGSYTIKAVKEYDVSGTKITYYGEKSINVSGDTGVELVIVPRLPNESGERCFWLRGFQLDKTTIQPNEYNSGFAEWIFAKCCPACVVYVVVYDYNGEEIARLWEGGDYGYTHTVIQKSFSFKAPSNPGTYCLTINVAYDYKPPPPNEGIVEKTCFTVTSNLVTTTSPTVTTTIPTTITKTVTITSAQTVSITITRLFTTISTTTVFTTTPLTITLTSPYTTTFTQFVPTTTTLHKIETQTLTTTTTIPTTITTAIPTTITVREITYTPTATITIGKSLFSEETTALTISITMIVTSALIGIKLRR
jgi:hypothetical protein